MLTEVGRFFVFWGFAATTLMWFVARGVTDGWIRVSEAYVEGALIQTLLLGMVMGIFVITFMTGNGEKNDDEDDTHNEDS